MHIKKLVLSGFKSYKEEVCLENLDEGFNVIVGLNGAGKSNLFSAIQLIFTEDFNKIGPLGRLALLHNGSLSHEAAYVEVIFDNADRKLPFEKDEVSFRRYIGGKKDRFVINGKTVDEFKSYLEAAGFINPYYFIKQGTVTEIATNSDAGRLKILKEITGSKIWEDSKALVSKILDSHQKELTKIEELYAGLLKTTEDLRADEAVLKEVLELEKHKRAYEYIIYNREMKSILEKVEKVETRRSELSNELQPIRAQLAQISNDLQTCALSAEVIKRRKNMFVEEQKSAYADIEKLTEIKFKERLAHKDLLAEILGFRNCKEEMVAKLQSIESEMKKLESKLEAKQHEYADCKRMEIQNTKLYEEAKTTSDQHRSKFGLVPRMDKTVVLGKDALKEIRKDRKIKDKELAEAQARVDSMKNDVRLFEANIETLKDSLVAGMGEHKILEESLIKTRRTMLDEDLKRRNCLEEEAKFEQTIYTHKENLDAFQQKLRRIAGRAKTAAWISVEIVLKELRTAGGRDDIISGYLGQVFENITCDKELWTAVEVCAGEKLFFHIVKSNAVGLAILTEFNRMKFHGDLVFLPLDKIQVPPRRNWNSLDSSTTTIRSKIQFNNKQIEKAVDYIFGNKLLCRDLEGAVQASKIHKTTCITLDGDKVVSSGPITGGYRGNAVSALGIQKQRSAEQSLLSLRESEISCVRQRYTLTDEEFQKLMRKKETIESNLAQMSLNLEKRNWELRLLMQKLRSKQDEEVLERNQVEKLEKRCLELQRKEDEFEEESGRPRPNKSTNLDSAKIKVLREDRKRSVRACAESRKAYEKLASLESKKIRLDSRIRNLADKKMELELALENDTEKLLNLKVEEAEHKVNALTKNIKYDNIKARQMGERIIETEKELQALKETINKYEAKENKLLNEFNEQSTQLDEHIARQVFLTNKLKECEKKTQGIGSFPTLVQDFEKLKSKDLLKKLNEVSARLKKCPQVNRIVGKLLQDTSESIQEIECEIGHAKKGHKEVEKLLSYIDEGKGGLVLGTCRALQKSFRKIFEELVPSGSGEIVLTSDNGVEFSELTVFDTDNTANIRKHWCNNNFDGLALRVRFTGDFSTSKQDLRQFSGGQKSIVALSFILALQSCDPVSVYLFDEVDQALDPQYRAAVARKLQQMSKEAQFVCTTFRREFLECADKFFGVYFRNQTSNVKAVSKAEAQEFIDDTPETSITPATTSDDSAVAVEKVRQNLYGDAFRDPENPDRHPELSTSTTSSFSN